MAAQTLSDPRVRRAAIAVLGALAAALLVAALSGSGTTTATGRLGGDQVEFYGTGKMVLDGDLDRLYDPDAQRAAQAPYAGEGGGFLYFGYPPHVAVLYAPLALLPFRLSWVVSTGVMVGAALGALALLRPVLPVLRTAFWPCAALCLTFAPLFVGVGLGQNTGISLLLIAGAWRLAHDDRDLAAGMMLGLLLFKPQLALPLVALFAISGRWRTVAGAAITGAATWVVCAAILGTSWVMRWLDGLDAFGEIDKASNAANNVSILGVADAISDGAPAARVAAVVLDVALAVLLALVWRRRGRADLTGAMALAVPGVLLLSPHALYYDGGLVVLTGLVVLSRLARSLPFVLATWALGLAHVLTTRIGVTPVALTVALALLGGWLALERPPDGQLSIVKKRSKPVVASALAGIPRN